MRLMKRPCKSRQPRPSFLEEDAPHPLLEISRLVSCHSNTTTQLSNTAAQHTRLSLCAKIHSSTTATELPYTLPKFKANLPKWSVLKLAIPPPNRPPAGRQSGCMLHRQDTTS
jgi:hypothetical protein